MTLAEAQVMSETEQEPSMEEILASIRRIISEDGEEESAADDEVSPEVEENVAAI